jgi:hypothetical protein
VSVIGCVGAVILSIRHNVVIGVLLERLVACITSIIAVFVSQSRVGHVTTVVIGIFHTVIVGVAIVSVTTARVLSASATHVFAVLADAVDAIDVGRVVAATAVNVIAVTVLSPYEVIVRALLWWILASVVLLWGAVLAGAAALGCSIFGL